MEKKLLVINAVGLTSNLISKKYSPTLYDIYCSNKQFLIPPYPAVTCTSQSDMLTGKVASIHGIVANGWYFKDRKEVKLWSQSNSLVEATKIWDVLKSKYSDFTTANLFWWYNMYSNVEYSVTPRPIYRANGLKYPKSYSYPVDLNDELEKLFGVFPLFNFWGPATDIKSTKWISSATSFVMNKYKPNLVLSYLPHLDYNLQRVGTCGDIINNDMQQLDAVISNLLSDAKKIGYKVIILSEYGIQDVSEVISLNRIFRENNLLYIRNECNEDHIDVGNSEAFAVCDHQIAHIYLKKITNLKKVLKILEKIDGIANILTTQEEKEHFKLNHDRSGDIICLAKNNSWFSYYYWLDDNKAPDYARTVDIHRKFGYDPVELFSSKFAKLKLIKNLLKKKLGFRYLMDVIPLDTSLVKGSHGVPTLSKSDGPVIISPDITLQKEDIEMRNVFDIILNFFDGH